MIYEAKQEINSLKQTHEREVKERKAELLESEKKLGQREDRLDSRSLSLDKREESLTVKENKIEEQEVVFLMDRFGYARTIDVSAYERNKEAAESENKYKYISPI